MILEILRAYISYSGKKKKKAVSNLQDGKPSSSKAAFQALELISITWYGRK